MPHAAFRLRPLAVADAAAAAALIRHAFAAQPVPLDPPPSALLETVEAVAARLSSGGGAGAFADDRLVGCLLWRSDQGGLYLSRVCVHPEWRRRGVAQALLREAETAARHRRLPYLWLSVRLALADNRRLFAAAGFVEGARHAHPGFAAPTYVDMTRRVGPDGATG